MWQTLRKTAVKVFERNTNYTLERDCYQRFAANGTTSILGFNVPQLVYYSDDLMIVEMTIVRAPYILDFGKVRLDSPPDYSQQTWSDWMDQNRELWEGRWPKVLSLLSALKEFGIYYVDPNPGNITFANDA